MFCVSHGISVPPEKTVTRNRKDKSSGTQRFDMTTQKIEFGVSGMHCGGCSGHLTTMLSELPGVADVKVDHVAGTASLTFDADKTTFEDITECVLDAGFEVVSGSLQHL